MARFSPSITARHLRAVCFFSLTVMAGISVYAVDNVVPATKPVVAVTPPSAAVKSAIKATATKPLWSELTPMQQQALEPLSAEWDKIDAFRKKKWLEIGSKYPTMKPDEQTRMHERMREWAKLTPDQRRVARESFARTNRMNSDEKSAQWHEYQQLPDDQKSKLAQDAKSKKHVATLPSAQNKAPIVPPIKSTPKPVLERSVTPQATDQSVIKPSSPPPATRP